MMMTKDKCPVCRGIAKGNSFVEAETLEAVESAGSYDAAINHLHTRVFADIHYKGAIGLHIRHFYADD